LLAGKVAIERGRSVVAVVSGGNVDLARVPREKEGQ
jgi:threonine dehydratase